MGTNQSPVYPAPPLPLSQTVGLLLSEGFYDNQTTLSSESG
jgi:hypothetical protein